MATIKSNIIEFQVMTHIKPYLRIGYVSDFPIFILGMTIHGVPKLPNTCIIKLSVKKVCTLFWPPECIVHTKNFLWKIWFEVFRNPINILSIHVKQYIQTMESFSGQVCSTILYMNRVVCKLWEKHAQVFTWNPGR